MGNYSLIEKAFHRIGAEVEIAEIQPRFTRSVTLDIRRFGRREVFRIEVPPNNQLSVIDTRPKERHLLVMTKNHGPTVTTSKFLCGHDERHWFTAAIPEAAPVSTVITAKQALKPQELVQFEADNGVKSTELHKRRRRIATGQKIYRQGEFMFVPDTSFQPTHPWAILQNEILARAGGSRFGRPAGNPHIAQFLYREGGSILWISPLFPDGISPEEYQKLRRKDNQRARMTKWRQQIAEPVVHVQGTIRHPEHATLHLGRIWHRVLINTEHKSIAMQHVRFID